MEFFLDASPPPKKPGNAELGPVLSLGEVLGGDGWGLDGSAILVGSELDLAEISLERREPYTKAIKLVSLVSFLAF